MFFVIVMKRIIRWKIEGKKTEHSIKIDTFCCRILFYSICISSIEEFFIVYADDLASSSNCNQGLSKIVLNCDLPFDRITLRNTHYIFSSSFNFVWNHICIEWQMVLNATQSHTCTILNYLIVYNWIGISFVTHAKAPFHFIDLHSVHCRYCVRMTRHEKSIWFEWFVFVEHKNKINLFNASRHYYYSWWWWWTVLGFPIRPQNAFAKQSKDNLCEQCTIEWIEYVQI